MNPNNSVLALIVHWIVSGLALMATAYFVPGFRVASFSSALFASVAIGLANVVIWPVLIFLTLPLNILTLGLLTFVINGAVLKICAALIPGFSIHTWFAAIVGSIILSLISGAFHFFLA